MLQQRSITLKAVFIMYLFILICFILLNIQPGTCDSRGTLKYLQIIWRHGDRTPIGFIPTDTRNDISSWGDQGQLTTLGMWQHFQLGQWIQKKYVEEENFLSGEYNSAQIRVESTDYNRTIMSAMSNFAGFFYNSSQNDTSSAKLPGIPVPVHMFGDSYDNVFNEICSDRCHTFREEVLESDDWKNTETEHQEFLKFLADKMGLEKITLLHNVPYDALTSDMWHCDASHCQDLDAPHSNPPWNLQTHPWPNWVNKSVYDKVIFLHEYRNNNYYYNPKFIKYCIGFLLNDIIENMLQRANVMGRTDKLPNRKYIAYSAHDDTVQSVLTQLGVFNGLPPPFASAVIFELRELNGKHYVELKYRNTTTNYLNPVPQYYQISIATCVDPIACTVEEFYNYALGLQRMIDPDNYDKDCFQRLPDDGTVSNKGIFVVTIVLVAVFGVTFVISVVLYRSTNKKNEINISNTKSIN